MSSVCERYKHVSMKAFMIVPLSGAVLIDLVANSTSFPYLL
ncbi:hypothetical protein FF38_00705 [Lucilia cuprina]|uniref:Uncharacterized protein n=1 Tax=Lucilia cuprina TaxID=7375 RepID=A0A0L0C350_LUCCU|nr:hypothetical protein FF38_00705 [Lucilia cuprina]